MKILITSFTYWPNRNGVQNVTQYQAEGLARLGHEVTVITTARKGCPSEETHNGVRIIRVNVRKRCGIPAGDKKALQEQFVQEAEQCDAVLCVCVVSYLDQWITPLLPKLHCAKIGILHGIYDFRFHRQDWSVRKFTSHLFHSLYLQWYLRIQKPFRYYDALTHLHEKQTSWSRAVRSGFQNNYVLSNAVGDEFFAPDAPEKENILINVSTFHENKNQILALRVFWKANPAGYRLVLIGQPENEYYRKVLWEKERLERQYGPRDVEILCAISREETVRLIRRAKAYLLTSTRENYPVSVLEAMAGGSVFISTDVGIMKYLPGGVICGTEADMIEAVRNVSELCDRYSGEAREYAEQNCGQDIQVRRLEKIILDTVRREKAPFETAVRKT